MSFDKLFNESKLPFVLKQAKTLSKEECRAIYKYFEKKKPIKVMEFGVQYGCSTASFLQIAKWLNIDIDLHSWDIVDEIKKECVRKSEFVFHKEDISGREREIIEEYQPDLVFLDAHPYYMTKAIVEVCLEKRIDFMTHDIALGLYEVIKKRSNNFSNLNAYGAWELYILQEIFGDEVLTEDSYEDDRVKIEFIRDVWGLSIIEVK